MSGIYLDNAATSFPKPEYVYKAMDYFMRELGGSPARGSYSKAQESERIVIKLRSKLCQLLGVSDPTRLLFTFNSTDALNLVLKGFLKPGDHVIVTDVEHNALLRPLWKMRQTHNIAVTIVKSNEHGQVSPEDIFKEVTPQTKLIACVHASNVLGTLQPIQEIGAGCKKRGIAFLVDGSQTAGAYPVDVDALGIDFFVFTGHKSLLGPGGTGGVIIQHGLELDSYREGGNGAHSDHLEQPTGLPERYESGTPNMLGYAGLLAGVEFIQEQGVHNIRAHELALNKALMEELQGIDQVKIYGPSAEEKVAITSIGFKMLDTSEVGQILGKKFNIMVRTGIHCSPLIHQNIGTKAQGTVRFSMGWFNTLEEIKKVGDAVREISHAVYGGNRS